MNLTELERELLIISEHYPIEAYLTWVEIMRTPIRSERLVACKRLNAIRRGYQLAVLPWPGWEDSPQRGKMWYVDEGLESEAPS